MIIEQGLTLASLHFFKYTYCVILVISDLEPQFLKYRYHRLVVFSRFGHYAFGVPVTGDLDAIAGQDGAQFFFLPCVGDQHGIFHHFMVEVMVIAKAKMTRAIKNFTPNKA